MSMSCGTSNTAFSEKDFQNYDCSDKSNKGRHIREQYKCCKMLKNCHVHKCREEDFDCNMTCPTNAEDGNYDGTFIAQADGTYIEALRNSGLNGRFEEEIDQFCNIVTCGPIEFVHKLEQWK